MVQAKDDEPYDSCNSFTHSLHYAFVAHDNIDLTHYTLCTVSSNKTYLDLEIPVKDLPETLVLIVPDQQPVQQTAADQLLQFQ